MDNATITNNIFVKSYNVINGVNNSHISDNIFKTNNTSGDFLVRGEYNQFYNNIYTKGTTLSETNSIQNNQFNIPIESVLVNADGETFSYDHDYHLTPNSPAKGAGVNGGDIGIYGGDVPYKEGAVPSNPHIQFVEIPSQTDSDGKLRVRVKVAAQNN